jgi:hypothetical protein
MEKEKITEETYGVLKRIGLHKIKDNTLKRIKRIEEAGYYKNPYYMTSTSTITGSSLERLNDILTDEFLYREDVKKPHDREENLNLRFQVKKAGSSSYRVTLKNIDTVILISNNYVLINGEVTNCEETKKYFKELLERLNSLTGIEIPDKIYIRELEPNTGVSNY